MLVLLISWLNCWDKFELTVMLRHNEIIWCLCKKWYLLTNYPEFPYFVLITFILKAIRQHRFKAFFIDFGLFVLFFCYQTLKKWCFNLPVTNMENYYDVVTSQSFVPGNILYTVLSFPYVFVSLSFNSYCDSTVWLLLSTPTHSHGFGKPMNKLNTHTFD